MYKLGAIPFLLLLGAAAALAILLAASIGSVTLTPAQVLAALGGGGDELARTLVMDLRLPRAMAAFATGGLLGVAGALMQVLLRNPLADPYILGVSGGAAVAALTAIMLGLSGLWLDGSAFAGALGATLLVFALAHGEGGWTPLRLLLTGVVIAAGFAALISLLLAIGPDSSLRGMLFWLMGDLSQTRSAVSELVILAIALALLMPLARHFNVLAQGEQLALSAGLTVRPLRIAIYLSSSLLTATAVTAAGSIGFVGLVVPHMIRRVCGPDHRVVLPGAALAGGILLVLADTLARTAMAPRQLPVGAITALLGVPLFLLLIRRRRVLS